MNEIIVALITGGVTLVGVLISNQKSQAVTDTKLEELTRRSEEHTSELQSPEEGQSRMPSSA